MTGIELPAEVAAAPWWTWPIAVVIAAAAVVLAWRLLRSITVRVVGSVVGILTAGLIRGHRNGFDVMTRLRGPHERPDGLRPRRRLACQMSTSPRMGLRWRDLQVLSASRILP